jgi:acetyltransferase-like isoleucine patch superfamily enzyme
MALTGARAAPITLGEDIWLGANVTIVPGVSVADGCVIGAGAVVTKDTQPMGVYMGVPARRVRDR